MYFLAICDEQPPVSSYWPLLSDRFRITGLSSRLFHRVVYWSWSLYFDFFKGSQSSEGCVRFTYSGFNVHRVAAVICQVAAYVAEVCHMFDSLLSYSHLSIATPFSHLHVFGFPMFILKSNSIIMHSINIIFLCHSLVAILGFYFTIASLGKVEGECFYINLVITMSNLFKSNITFIINYILEMKYN